MHFRIRKLDKITHVYKASMLVINRLSELISDFYDKYYVKLKINELDKVNIFVVEDNDYIVGITICNTIRTLGKKTLVIDEVFVDEAYRGKGIGTQLIEYCINIAKEDSSYDAVELLVNRDNIEAKNLYIKCGFEGTDKIHMVKILKEWIKNEQNYNG